MKRIDEWYVTFGNQRKLIQAPTFEKALEYAIEWFAETCEIEQTGISWWEDD